MKFRRFSKLTDEFLSPVFPEPGMDKRIQLHAL